MKKIERNQATKLQSYLKIVPGNTCLAIHHALICGAILVGDLKLSGQGDSGGDAVLTKGEAATS